jgi:CRISPR-associated exonuclease Cas4
LDHSNGFLSDDQKIGCCVIILYLSLFFLVAALGLFFISARQKKNAGIAGGRVIYSDTSKWSKVEKPLYDPYIRLAGKPDYLVELGKQVIPIEVKSRRAPQAPFDSHIFQLAAYCLLVQHEYGNRPNYGIIHYPNRTFEINFTSALEDSTRDIIRQMQERKSRSQVARSHENPHFCKRCGYRSICDQSLRI